MRDDNIVLIDSLECFAKHGVYKEENILGQKFLVSARLEVNRVAEDEVEFCVNYGEVCHFITEYMQANTFKLLEALAEALAGELLVNFAINSLTLRIEKPWAPVGLPLKSVGVEIKRSWHRAYIAFGSNMGDREAHINSAIEALRATDTIRVGRVSSIIETEPYGVTEQASFLNGCLRVDTLLEPLELLKVLNKIELDEKRERIQHWGPRTLDLDILLYDDVIIESERLTVPHTDMHNRGFVLEPMCEIAPYARHSGFGKTMLELRNELNNK
jgi:dihydroneopterin aldolase/2-amino-4-hydroxy-6-hydroxymethyldihydropteridine diphosphokinase